MKLNRRLLLVMLMALGNVYWIPSAVAGKRLALIVASNRNASQRLSKDETELNTEKDASKLRYVLSNAGYDVTLLSDAEADRTGRDENRPSHRNIQQHLQTITTDAELKESGSVIVILAGPVKQLYRDKDPKKTLAAMKGEGSPPFKLFFESGDAPSQGLSFDRLNAEEVTDAQKLIDIESSCERLARCDAPSKLMILDVCRGRRSFGYPESLPAVHQPPEGVAVIWSCSPGETSVDEPRSLGSGVFMHHLLCGLHGSADGVLADKRADDAISIAELAEYVRDRTRNHMSMWYGGKPLSPETRGNQNVQVLGGCDTDIPLLKVDRSQWGKKAGDERTFALNDEVKIKMAWCPPGQFLMGGLPVIIGSEDKRKNAVLAVGFWLAKTELTQG